jgi:predicted amidohydrolase YtcJ
MEVTMDKQNCNKHSSFATIIIYNGKIITVDSKFNIFQAVAIRNDTILAVGKNQDMNPFKTSYTKMINLEGKTVIPGLIDSHIHSSLCAKEINNFSLTEAKSINDLLQAVEERVLITKPGEWVISSSAWHESQLLEGRLPTRWELDTISTNHPVMIPRGGHVLVVNSKALELAKFTKDTQNPDHGVIVKDPETNEPTGVLMESAANIVRNLVTPLTKEQITKGAIDFMKELNTYGITGMTDAWANDNDISIYSALNEQNKITVRTQALYPVMNLKETLHAVSKYKPFQGDDYFRLGGIKTMVDGGVEAAWMKQPHKIVAGMQPDPKYHGVPLYAGTLREKEFLNILRVVAKKGFQMQVHAAGDAANEFVVNSYEEVNKTIPIKHLRWVVMHVMCPTVKTLDKIKELNVLATVQNHPYLLGRNMKNFWGEQRANKAIPLSTMLNKGIIMGGGTDSPIVPSNPFISISWMSTRCNVNGEIQGIDEAISREEALYLWTMGSAYTQRNENNLGSIEPGKLADLVILSADLLTIPVEEIKSIKALTTIVGGKIVYQSN